jgi:hypothetical protein
MEYLYLIRWEPHPETVDEGMASGVSYSMAATTDELASLLKSVLGEASFNVQIKEVDADFLGESLVWA